MQENTGTMVSTRGVKYKFSEGERVLCYEPDPTKTKVLYDSKVLGIIESKDKRGRRMLQYKIHFQGWNSSWDRKVNADYVLKDTEENRQLQRDLAEKAQLELGAFLYRRERKKQKQKRNRKESNTETSPKSQNRGSIEDDSSCSTFERNEVDYLTRDDQMLDCDTESHSDSIESSYDEDRVVLNVGDKLKQYLEYDYDMITNNKKLHNLPAEIPAITILENFVKQSAMKMVFCSSQLDSARRRNPQLRPEKREKDLDKMQNTISLLKEVADGLRIYLNFTLKDYLLYREEKQQVEVLTSEENLQEFTYVPLQIQNLDCLNNIKIDINDSLQTTTTSESYEHTTNQFNNDNKITENQNNQDDNSRRRLRSYKNEENDILLDFNFGASKQDCYSSIASTSSGSSTPHTNMTSSNPTILKIPSSISIPIKIKEFLQNIFSWQILPSDAKPEISMIYGAIHLARLLVKLPDFLNASTMPDEKLKVLLQHLDSFASYLETHKEWFGDHNYYTINQQQKQQKCSDLLKSNKK